MEYQQQYYVPPIPAYAPAPPPRVIRRPRRRPVRRVIARPSSAPPTRQRARVPPPRPAQRPSNTLALVLSDATDTFMRSLSNTSFVASLAFAAIVLVSHATSLMGDDSGVLNRAISMIEHPPYKTWMTTNLHKLLAMVGFVPVLWTAPVAQQLPQTALVVVVVLVLPALSVATYSCAAVTTHLFNHCRLKTTRMSIIVLTVGLVYLSVMDKIGATKKVSTLATQMNTRASTKA